MTKFPHITELGLKVYSGCRWDCANGEAGFIDSMVLASDLNHLLSQGVRVYNACSANGFAYEGTWFKNETHTATHSALLIGVRPIQKPDSLEQLARDLAATAKFENGSWTMNTEYWVERARRLVK